VERKRLYRFLGACSGWGAQIRSCELGPQALLEANLFEKLKSDGIQIEEIEMLFPLKMANEEAIPLPQCLPLIHEFNLRLARAATETMERGQFPIAFGGDHSNAVGMWNGVRRALLKKTSLPMGLLWIDAHMDGHIPETTPSGAWHGMPNANLLGYGKTCLSQLLQQQPVVSPENLVLIGVRSFEEGEAALLEKLKVKIYFIEEVKKRGLKVILEEALPRVAANTAGFGVSLDLDVIDPQEAPGVGSPEPGGMSAKELLSVLPMLGKHPNLVGFEMVEYNPERDLNSKTLELVYQILKQIL